MSSQALSSQSQSQAFKNIYHSAVSALNGGFDCLSSGQKVAAALVLNRHDWLTKIRYTIPEALYRLDEGWAELMPLVERMLKDEGRI